MTRNLLSISLLMLIGHTSIAQISHLDPTSILRQYQASRADTGRVRLLLEWGRWYLDKSGNDATDLDSATLLFSRARELSLRLEFPQGAEQAAFLTGKVLVDRQDHPGLLRMLPGLSDTNRSFLTAEAIADLMNPFKRNPSRVDTAMLLARETLRLNKNSPHLSDQLSPLLKFAIYRFCNEHIPDGPAPSPSWTIETNWSHPRWYDSVFDWMALQLRDDSSMSADLAYLRNRLGSDQVDQKELIDRIRYIFLYFFGIEAGANAVKNNLALAEKEYMLAIGFDRTSPQIEIITFYTVAIFLLNHGELQKSLSLGLEAIKILEKEKGARVGSQMPYYAVGRIYSDLNQPALALECYQKALSLIREQGLQPPAMIIWGLISARIALGQARAGLAFLQDSINKSLLTDHNYQRIVLLNIGECYYAMGKYDEARACYIKGWEQAQHLDTRQQMLTAFYLAKIYTHDQQFEKARPYIMPVVSDSGKSFIALRTMIDAYHILFQIDSGTKNYIAAIRDFQTYKSLNDSLFDIAKNGQIENLKQQYQTEKKDQDLLLQQADLRQGRTVRNGLLTGAILLILLLALLFSRYRAKQRTNQLLRLLNDRQQRSLVEKEWMMREVHHRVKNNLQIVISLLNTQAAQLKDELALSAFGDIRSRIRAISLIHQQLYQDNHDQTLINMPEYINELVGFLEDSLAPQQRIHFHIQTDPIRLDASQCVPLGLILNEAITNSIKYAFPAGAEAGSVDSAEAAPAPEIRVFLLEAPHNTLLLTIADNGVGLPENIDPGCGKSLGFQLIHTLTAQLDGRLTLQNQPGLAVCIQFQYDPHPHEIPVTL